MGCGRIYFGLSNSEYWKIYYVYVEKFKCYCGAIWHEINMHSGFLMCSLWFSKESMKRLSGDCIYKPDYKGLPVHLFHIFIRLPKASAAHDGSSGSHYLASIIISSF